MPESLLAAQREAIAEAIRAAIRERYATSDWDRTEWEAAADAVLVLVGAWLVEVVQAERERLLRWLETWADRQVELGWDGDASEVRRAVAALRVELAVVSQETEAAP